MEKTENLDLSKYDALQKEILEQAIRENVNLSIISNPGFNGFQMKYILDGIRNNWNIDLYATTDFNEEQMSAICSGFRWQIDPTEYTNPSLSYIEMRSVWKSLVHKSKLPN